MDPVVKLRHTIDALFGDGVSRGLPRDGDLQMTFSRKSGRIRTVSHDGGLLCTLRIDGGLAISPHFAQTLLVKGRGFLKNCVKVNADAAPFVREGRSVFCRHVVWCGQNVRVSADTPVLFEDRVIAVGRAALSREMISDFDRGVAVRVRDSLKGPGDKTEP